MFQDIAGRVQRILFSPAAEWDAIGREPAHMGEIYKNYVLPLAVFAALCVGLGFLWNGLTAREIRLAAMSIVSGLIGVYVYALIIDALAPSFGGRKNFGQAFKVAAYSPTAMWVASMFAVIPPLRLLLILGLYSFYLLYLGIPKLMRAPADKALLYTAAAIVCSVIAIFLVNVLLSVIGFGYYFI